MRFGAEERNDLERPFYCATEKGEDVSRPGFRRSLKAFVRENKFLLQLKGERRLGVDGGDWDGSETALS